MTSNGKTILVVEQDSATAEEIAELIEFMDSPPVVVASPRNWREHLVSETLEALVLGPGLSDLEIKKLMRALESVDPNIPVVMMNEPDR